MNSSSKDENRTTPNDGPPPTFKEAVEFATQYLKDCRYDPRGYDRFTGSGEQASDYATISLFLLNQFPDTLDAKSAHGFDILRYAFASMIENGEAIPSERRELAASMMRGETSEPMRKPGASKHYLHKCIRECVSELVCLGMNATRNDATSSKQSACDAVATALENMTLKPMSFFSVKSIWQGRD